MKRVGNYFYYLLKAFRDVLFPRECVVCKKALLVDEKHLCLECLSDIPFTFFWQCSNSAYEKVFWGRVDIKKVMPLFFFREESNYKNILHEIKYRENRKLGYLFGQILGEKILKLEDWSDIDLIIPTPLHWKKRWIRGYNQSYIIAKGVASVLKRPIANRLIIRKEFTSTQTKKSRVDRWNNVANAFHLRSRAKIEHKHILLIDDVLTTGATLEACSSAILKSKGTTVSIATLAFVE